MALEQIEDAFELEEDEDEVKKQPENAECIDLKIGDLVKASD